MYTVYFPLEMHYLAVMPCLVFICGMKSYRPWSLTFASVSSVHFS